MDARDLTLTEAVLLGHAVVSAAAQAIGVRALFIKGPYQDSLGLRQPRQSVDVDVLTNPADAARLRLALEEVGWHVRVPLTRARVIPLHSTTLACAGWPCEIDLHHQFPGFFADPTHVFEILWERRTETAFAGVTAAVPDFLGSVLLAALHLERDPLQYSDELKFLKLAVREAVGTSELWELVDLADAVGATAPLRGFFKSVGAPVPSKFDASDDMRAWDLRASSSGINGVGWLYQFRRANWRQRLTLARQGLLSTEPELRAAFPQAKPGFLGTWQARWWRIARAIGDLPRAIALLRRHSQRG